MSNKKTFSKTTLSIKDEQLLCTMSQAVPETILEEFYDNTAPLLNQSIPTITDISTVHPTEESNGLCVTKISFLIPKEIENYDDIKTLIESVNNLLNCATCSVLVNSTMLEEQLRVKNIFKDFSSKISNIDIIAEHLAKKRQQPTSQYDNMHKPCIAAILTKVGTKRAQTANLIANYCDITKESASATFLKVLNGSAGEFLSLFHDTNKANEFSERMRSLGNEVMLQQ